MGSSTSNSIVYQARLHWIIFFWPAIVFASALYVSEVSPLFRNIGHITALLSLVWLVVMVMTYYFSVLIIKERQIILCTGILTRQTLDLSLNKIESIDIRQSVLGSLFQYGSLVITGTGGTRQYINYLNQPLTCRRHIEQLMHI